MACPERDQGAGRATSAVRCRVRRFAHALRRHTHAGRGVVATGHPLRLSVRRDGGEGLPGHRPPAEFERAYYDQERGPAAVAGLKQPSLG